jgi:hypothetical protein
VLGLRGNGDLKGPPSEIDVVAVQGEKVWTQMMAKPVDKKDPRGDITREDNAMTAFTACFARAAPSQSWFATAIRKAQSQLDLLPLR